MKGKSRRGRQDFISTSLFGKPYFAVLVNQKQLNIGNFIRFDLITSTPRYLPDLSHPDLPAPAETCSSRWGPCSCSNPVICHLTATLLRAPF